MCSPSAGWPFPPTVKEEIQKILSAYETGVRLVTVELQDVTPPDAVKPAFNEVNEARQDKERTINQAQEQANREIPKAGGEAARSISEAEGYAIERVNRARGEATRFRAVLAEYQQAPEVTRRRLYLEALAPFLTEAKASVYRGQRSEGPGALASPGIGSEGSLAAADWRREVSRENRVARCRSSSSWLAILLVLSGTFYTLEEGQQAVIVQFGRPVGETVTEAGLHVKLPFVQEVRRFEKRLLIWDGDPNQIPTKGREFIWVDTTARWRIADAKKFLENVATEEGAQSRLNDIIDSVVRDQVSSSELVELVRSASWEVPVGEVLEEVPAEREEELKKEITRGREEITRTILAEARKIIPQYGIELVDVRIKRLELRGERPGEGVRPDDLRAEAHRRPVPVRGGRAECGDPRDDGEGAASDPLHRLPAGAGDPGQGRRRGDARLRRSLQPRSRVLCLLAHPGGLWRGAEQELRADPHHGQRLLSLPQACGS